MARYPEQKRLEGSLPLLHFQTSLNLPSSILLSSSPLPPVLRCSIPGRTKSYSNIGLLTATSCNGQHEKLPRITILPFFLLLPCSHQNLNPCPTQPGVVTFVFVDVWLWLAPINRGNSPDNPPEETQLQNRFHQLFVRSSTEESGKRLTDNHTL